MKSKDNAVTGLTKGIEFLFKKNGVDYLKGWGKFESTNDIAVDLNDGKKTQIKAKHTIIATGSEPTTFAPGVLDVDEKYVVTSTGALSLSNIPKRMIVIGGGVIGLEMGSVYNRLGTEVTVLQHSDFVCPFLDTEIAKHFQKILQKQGLKIMTNTRFKSGVNNKEKGVQCVVETPKGEQTIEADVVLLSIGRRPYTGGLQLEKAGLSTIKNGKLEINKTW
jgi:dihydrolipoamide dehydrogenase